MKRICWIVFCCICMACSKYDGVPEKYHALLDEALAKADSNRSELAWALKQASPEMKE